jgi:hypothetical protein
MRPLTRPSPSRISRRFPESAQARRPLSRSGRCAFWLMLLGAALELAAAVVAVGTEGSLVPAFARSDPGSARGIAVAHGETLLAESVVAAVFWLVMAFLNRSARGDGPRIFSVVLFCAGTRQAWQCLHDPNSAATLSVTVVLWLVGLAAVMFLFSDELSRSFRTALRRTRHVRASASNP